MSSPLVYGSLNSNDSDPIDIERASSGTPTSPFASSLQSAVSPTLSFRHHNKSFSGSHASSNHRRSSHSRSLGSFVGSYEESILNGRMSQTPSRPLDFTASIGVLGKGKCKPNLRCPPHLNVPFPAYFYSETSPYVGQIDVEQIESRRGYRIPAEGQLQIIIKNPNKAAIKLFLIPYDVSDMPPSSKTFFRQKHYDDDKLRYAIHVQICCPAEGKYYIHKSQRVVFANRMPDSKEHLRVIIQAPDEKYSPWVPEKRQKKVEQHQRPDAKEPNFIGGSLLDRDHDIPEQEEQYTDGPLDPSGQQTPRAQTFYSDRRQVTQDEKQASGITEKLKALAITKSRT